MRPKGIGPLEIEVLEVLWESGGWRTPGEVHLVINARREIAYTTAMTALSNLWKKGLLERRKDGRAYAYHPVQSREERAATQMSNALHAVSDRPTALANFLDDLDSDELSQLRRMLKDR